MAQFNNKVLDMQILAIVSVFLVGNVFAQNYAIAYAKQPDLIKTTLQCLMDDITVAQKFNGELLKPLLQCRLVNKTWNGCVQEIMIRQSDSNFLAIMHMVALERGKNVSAEYFAKLQKEQSLLRHAESDGKHVCS